MRRLTMRANGVVSVAVAFAVCGCAVTSKRFEESKYSMSDADLCGAIADADKTGDLSFISSVADERVRRNLSLETCEQLVAEKRRKIALAAAAIVGVALIAAAASRGGGGAGSSYAPSGVSDYAWQWDQFRNDRGQLVWACRGEQTGQFADTSRCNYKVKSDWKWPGP